MTEQDKSSKSKAEFYESKRVDYFLPPHGKEPIEQFSLSVNDPERNPVELRRQVAASMTAFWQADEAYKELEAKLRAFETLVSKYQCNPTGQLSAFEALSNLLVTVHRTCNENYDWAKRVEAQLEGWKTQAAILEHEKKLIIEIGEDVISKLKAATTNLECATMGAESAPNVV